MKSIVKEGDYGIEDTIAVLTDEEGNDVKGEYDSEMAREARHDEL